MEDPSRHKLQSSLHSEGKQYVENPNAGHLQQLISAKTERRLPTAVRLDTFTGLWNCAVEGKKTKCWQQEGDQAD